MVLWLLWEGEVNIMVRFQVWLWDQVGVILTKIATKRQFGAKGTKFGFWWGKCEMPTE